jgi:hypothetical protein
MAVFGDGTSRGIQAGQTFPATPPGLVPESD